jgi:hypothetical protein
MVLFFWHFIDIKEHGSQYVKEQLWCIQRASFDHHQKRLQHGV